MTDSGDFRHPLLCRLRHKWAEVSRITWKNDGYSQGKANQRCSRQGCPARRSIFLTPEDIDGDVQ